MKKNAAKRKVGGLLLPNNQSSKNRLYRMYFNRARDKKLSFLISKELFNIFLSQNCYYCGREPSNKMKEKTGSFFTYNGIDRRINTAGYTEENCVPCCVFCNRIKLNLDEASFLKKVKDIYFNRIK